SRRAGPPAAEPPPPCPGWNSTQRRGYCGTGPPRRCPRCSAPGRR
ncbi:hypothetical protein AKKGGB_AKKGGB_16875, partial [Dysosmobacter welbionis]